MSKLRNLVAAHPQAWHICIGLLITALLIGAKIVFEHSALGHRVELLTYELLQGQLTGIDKDPLPVVVLDISAIPGGTAGQPTPRADLTKLIEAIAAGSATTKSRAIGIDIDFSPGLQGPQDPLHDATFFDFCLLKSSSIPIYLGVHRTIASSPRTWLGIKDHIPLAAAVYADPDDTARLPVWFEPPGKEKQRLPALGTALAESYRKGSLPQPRWWLRPFVHTSQEVTINLEDASSHPVLTSERLINYSKLELLQQTAIPIKNAEGITQIIELLNNKVVILGRVRDATDRFNVPGRDTPVAGVFLHASAAQTFIKEPLFELNLAFRLLADFLISFLIIFLVARIRFRKNRAGNINWHRRQKIYTYTAAVLIFVAGFMLVRYASVMWFDFVPLIVALLVHLSVERRVEKFIERKTVTPGSEVEATL
jgi:CHASE2 domain-containing sensor protein